jgi:hypothetical protein
MRRRLFASRNRRVKTRLRVRTLPSPKFPATQKRAIWALLALCTVAAIWFVGSHLPRHPVPAKKAAIARSGPLEQSERNAQPVLDPDLASPKIITFAQANPINPNHGFPTEQTARSTDEENLAKTESSNPPPDNSELPQTIPVSPRHSDRVLAERDRRKAESKRLHLEKQYRKGQITAEAYQSGQEEYRSAIEKYRKSLKGNARE